MCVKRLSWPDQTPDLIHIEYLCNKLELYLRTREIRNLHLRWWYLTGMDSNTIADVSNLLMP